MKKDYLFESDEYICGVRTVAVLIKDNKLLVQREKDGNEYALPGGHIKIGETSEEGLIRETEEEMGVKITCKRPLWIEESFWKWKGKTAHYTCFYHMVELSEPYEIPEDEFVSQKDNCGVVIGWLPIDKIYDVVIYPEFIKKEIFRLNEPLKHFVSKD